MAAARRPRRRQGENRERLLAAGIAEFAAKGYHGSSTAAIAAMADVPQPHVYANFRTKQELFLACAAKVHQFILESAVVRARGSQLEYDNQEARFLYQLVALAEDAMLGQEARELASKLRAALGKQRFNEVLICGGHSLLEYAADKQSNA